MKKIILGIIFMSTLLFANEPSYYGAYYGDMKDKIGQFDNYPNNSSNSAGTLYLYNNKLSDVQYILDTKNEHIKEAREEAKKYAIKKKYSKYAIDNIKHQVIVTENKVIVLTDYNVIVFN